MIQFNDPILVTGAHRSGTTWVGKTLAEAKTVGYIHEPFHPQHPPGICSAEFWGPYVFLDGKHAETFTGHLASTLTWRYNWVTQLQAKPKRRYNIIKTLREGSQFEWARSNQLRPLMKDPLALLSAEWLAKRFNMRVVMLVRHPAAFVSSIKRMGWANYPFDVFLQQPLVKRQLHPYVDEARAYKENLPDIIDQACLTWRILNYFVDQYRQRHPDWILIRHEDVAANPVEEFTALYRQLGLDMTDRIKGKIYQETNANNPGEAPDNRFRAMTRDSQATTRTWQERLSFAEIARIRRSTEDVWRLFYDEESWQ